MKHDEILSQLTTDAKNDANILGFFVFGSVARGTQREDSDIDIMTIYRSKKPTSGIDNYPVVGIKVGNLFFTFDILVKSVEDVPYLLHPLGEAKLLFDRNGEVSPQLDLIKGYFADHPEIVEEWDGYYALLKQEKAQFGYEKTTIVDVWNEMERRHAGKIRRKFFNSFLFTNSFIFSLLKKLM